jgi:hypothetical protein
VSHVGKILSGTESSTTASEEDSANGGRSRSLGQRRSQFVGPRAIEAVEDVRTVERHDHHAVAALRDQMLICHGIRGYERAADLPESYSAIRLAAAVAGQRSPSRGAEATFPVERAP